MAASEASDGVRFFCSMLDDVETERPSSAYREQGLEGAAKCLEDLLSVLKGGAGDGRSSDQDSKVVDTVDIQRAKHPQPCSSRDVVMDGEKTLAFSPGDLHFDDSSQLIAAVQTREGQLGRSVKLPPLGHSVKLPPLLSPKISSDLSPSHDVSFNRTSATIFMSPTSAPPMDRQNRLLELLRQREDELVLLKSERSNEFTRLQVLLQRREEEIAELQSRQLGTQARTLSETVTRAGARDIVETQMQQLKEDIENATAKHEKELSHVKSLLQKSEDELARAHARHALELEEVREMLRAREAELARFQAKDMCGQTSADTDALNQNLVALQSENLNLKSELHEKKWALERAETEAEKDDIDSIEFIKRLSFSSSVPTLDQHFDMDSTKVLGMGKYGYVMACKTKKSGDRVVLKLQSERWVGCALTEWSHGREVGVHPNIVEHIEVLLHRDEGGQIRRKLEDAFNEGILRGKRPKLLPTRFICLAVEFMDRGTVQNFIDKQLLTVTCIAAMTQQIACGLAFMHKKKRTHNDVKPENILLCAAPQGDHLIAKLADLGLADHSMDQRRDRDLFAYTVWCTALTRKFERCPQTREDRQVACTQFAKLSRTDLPEQQLLRSLHTILEGLWLRDDVPIEQAKDILPNRKLKIQVPDDHRHVAELESSAELELHLRAARKHETLGRRARVLTTTAMELDGESGDEQLHVQRPGLVSFSKSGELKGKLT